MLPAGAKRKRYVPGEQRVSRACNICIVNPMGLVPYVNKHTLCVANLSLISTKVVRMDEKDELLCNS
jgi:hypothetical protein